MDELLTGPGIPNSCKTITTENSRLTLSWYDLGVVEDSHQMFNILITSGEHIH